MFVKDYGKFKIGTVVVDHSNKDEKPVHPGFLGHVIGFELAEYEELYDVIIKVRWCNGKESSHHPNNITTVGYEFK